ncbi:SIS domain-containing protein, partial [Eubacteriales bacterium OttesenSCG-928-A19]|nr:SIS domain-containing protein [Eubacteriales bacterium OttesenSCG-928-A19]
IRGAMPLLEKGDAVVIVSASGLPEQLILAARWACAQGAATIAITNRMDAPLAQVSDIPLITTGGPFLLNDEWTLSRFSQLGVVNALYLGIAMSKGEAAMEALRGRAEEAHALQ